MDYENYEEDCERIRKNNEKLVSKFIEWLSDSKLTQRTIQRHVENVEFYIDHYLLYDDLVEPEHGWEVISTFLGYWFIKKAMWADTTTLKQSATSLKKFYQFLQELGKISKDDFITFKKIIKEEMPDWLATMERYDDPSIDDMEDVWQF
jgi:site-specific recombinase XerD